MWNNNELTKFSEGILYLIIKFILTYKVNQFNERYIFAQLIAYDQRI